VVVEVCDHPDGVGELWSELLKLLNYAISILTIIEW